MVSSLFLLLLHIHDHRIFHHSSTLPTRGYTVQNYVSKIDPPRVVVVVDVNVPAAAADKKTNPLLATSSPLTVKCPSYSPAD